MVLKTQITLNIISSTLTRGQWYRENNMSHCSSVFLVFTDNTVLNEFNQCLSGCLNRLNLSEQRGKQNSAGWIPDRRSAPPFLFFLFVFKLDDYKGIFIVTWARLYQYITSLAYIRCMFLTAATPKHSPIFHFLTSLRFERKEMLIVTHYLLFPRGRTNRCRKTCKPSRGKKMAVKGKNYSRLLQIMAPVNDRL